MRVQHRHIIYIQGYDPRGLAQYYRMFRTELRKFGRLYQLRHHQPAQGRRPTTRSHPGPSRPRPRTGRPAPAYDFLRFEDFIQRDLAAPIWRTVLQRGVDLLAAGLRRHHRAILAGRTGGSRPSSPTRISCCCWRPSCAAAHRLCLREGTACARHSRHLSASPPRSPCSSPLLGTVLKYTENADLSALSAVGHDLDLGILAPRAAGMGPAHRPLCPASRQDGARAPMPRKSSSSATVRDRSWRRKCWRAR